MIFYENTKAHPENILNCMTGWAYFSLISLRPPHLSTCVQ